jgi:hypothetical protein
MNNSEIMHINGQTRQYGVPFSHRLRNVSVKRDAFTLCVAAIPRCVDFAETPHGDPRGG